MTDAFRPALVVSLVAHLAGVWLLPPRFLRVAGQGGERERISIVGVVELPSPEPPAPRPRRLAMDKPLLPLRPHLVEVPGTEPAPVGLARPWPRAVEPRGRAIAGAAMLRLPPQPDLPRDDSRDYRMALPELEGVARVKKPLAPDLTAVLREEAFQAAAQEYRPPRRARPGSRSQQCCSTPDPRARYLAEVLRRLQRAKYFPRQARSRGVGGTAEVEFVIRADGHLGGVALARSSGSAVLDRAAKRIVERASPFEPLPGDLGTHELRVVVPVAFRLEALPDASPRKERKGRND